MKPCVSGPRVHPNGPSNDRSRCPIREPGRILCVRLRAYQIDRYFRPTEITVTRPRPYFQAVSSYAPQPGVEGGDGLAVVVPCVVVVEIVVVVVGCVVVVETVVVVVGCVIVVVGGDVVVVTGSVVVVGRDVVVVGAVDGELLFVPETVVVVGSDVDTADFDVVVVEIEIVVVVTGGMVTAVGPGASAVLASGVGNIRETSRRVPSSLVVVVSSAARLASGTVTELARTSG